MRWCMAQNPWSGFTTGSVSEIFGNIRNGEKHFSALPKGFRMLAVQSSCPLDACCSFLVSSGFILGALQILAVRSWCLLDACAVNFLLPGAFWTLVPSGCLLFILISKIDKNCGQTYNNQSLMIFYCFTNLSSTPPLHNMNLCVLTINL